MRQCLIILLVLGLAGCGNNFHLTTNEIAFNPYKESDILIFQSDSNQLDTIFVLKVERFSSPTDPLAIFPDIADILYVMVKHSDPWPPGGKQRYLTNWFLEIRKTNNHTAIIDFFFSAMSAHFYDDPLAFSDIKDMQTISLTTLSGTYNDVICFDSPNQEYRDREDFIKTIYWSKTSGYVRFDLLNGLKWELKKKIEKTLVGI